MTKKLNTQGFASAEAVLIVVIVAILGGTGYYVYHAHNKTSDTLNQASLESQSAVATKNIKTKAADSAAVTAAVKAYSPVTGTALAATKVSVKEVVGNNAKGTLDSSTSVFVAHKDSGKWTVVYEGQQLPGKDIGTKYSLPKSWYSTKY